MKECFSRLSFSLKDFVLQADNLVKDQANALPEEIDDVRSDEGEKNQEKQRKDGVLRSGHCL